MLSKIMLAGGMPENHKFNDVEWLRIKGGLSSTLLCVYNPTSPMKWGCCLGVHPTRIQTNCRGVDISRRTQGSSSTSTAGVSACRK